MYDVLEYDLFEVEFVLLMQSKLARIIQKVEFYSDSFSAVTESASH